MSHIFSFEESKLQVEIETNAAEDAFALLPEPDRVGLGSVARSYTKQ